MEKYDIKVAHRELYAPKGRDFHIVEVPPLTYLATDGSGDPNTSPGYTAAVEALYTLAYSIKAHSRTRLGRDFVVAPLEGLWRADDLTAFVRRDKAAWQWTMLIALPGWVTGDAVDAARASARARKDLPAIDRVTVRTLTEGTSVQILHIGPYDDEGPTGSASTSSLLPTVISCPRWTGWCPSEPPGWTRVGTAPSRWPIPTATVLRVDDPVDRTVPRSPVCSVTP